MRDNQMLATIIKSLNIEDLQELKKMATNRIKYLNKVEKEAKKVRERGN